MAPSFFRILLALVALYAMFCGRRDERVTGVILVLGVIATHYAWTPVDQRFAGLEFNVMLVDLIVFAGFVWVALRSDRFWPLWIAGLQLTTLLGHFLKLADAGLLSRAYGAALMFWGYPILLILAIGTWRGERRRHQRLQPT
ncbi:MAG: hypothetical protein V4513_04750 [Pseudomonadota bacterium]